MGKEEWIMARNRIAKIDEHFESWMQRLNGSGKNSSVITWLKSQVESYKVHCYFLLRFLVSVLNNSVVQH